MVLGSLLDAGASIDAVRESLATLPISGWSLDAERVVRSGISATRAVVSIDDDRVERDYRTIVEILDAADLPERVAARSHAAFLALASAEAAIHAQPIEDVHFHEVGGHDALVDIVGTMAALEELGVDEVVVSPITLGSGTILTRHGEIPNPAPATVALLKGFEVIGSEARVELATPTGAAIVNALAKPLSPLPLMEVVAQGFGAGTRDLDGRANVVGVVVGTHRSMSAEMVAVLETTIDDLTGEQAASAISSLLGAGALDAWMTPVAMKKARVGSVLTVLARPFDSRRITKEIMQSTGSLGVRASIVMRSTLERRVEEVTVLGYAVRIKVSDVRAKPEFDDVVAASKSTGRTIFEIEALALRAYLEGSAEL
jgi:uncharacterized protein (TIGR00299 family) protein